MDIRKKILLGNKDILSRAIEDIYIDVNISKDNKEIIPYKYENVFDLTKFYNQERNQSRNFVVYGTIDSCSWDCNNLEIEVYQSPNFTPQNYLCTVNSEYVVNENVPCRNIYYKLKGKYIIDNIPNYFTGCSIYLKIREKNENNYQIYTQQLIFTTLTLSQTGEKVIEQLNYGLNEAITDCDGNVTEINNDFDFFYNKHWIRKNINFLDLRKKWVGDNNTLYCLTETNKTFHNRTIPGFFNTGYAFYGTIMELYQVNDVQTGEYETNDLNSLHYIPKFLSSGMCPIPSAYTVTANISYIPAEGNLIYTSPTTGATIIFNPDDYISLNASLQYRLHNLRQYFQTEALSFSSINQNSFWEYKHFVINEQIFSASEYSTSSVTQDIIAQAFYQEVCPWKLSYTASPIFHSGNTISGYTASPICCSGNTYTGTSAVFSITPLKTVFCNNEIITAKTMGNYYIDSYILDDIYYNAPVDNKIIFPMTANTSLFVNYNKYVNLRIRSNAVWDNGIWSNNGNDEINIRLSGITNEITGTTYNLLNSANSGITFTMKCGDAVPSELLTKKYTQYNNGASFNKEIDYIKIFTETSKIHPYGTINPFDTFSDPTNNGYQLVKQLDYTFTNNMPNPKFTINVTGDTEVIIIYKI